MAMNWIALGEFDRSAIIHRVARDIKQAAEDTFAHRHADRRAGIVDAHAAFQSFRG